MTSETPASEHSHDQHHPTAHPPHTHSAVTTLSIDLYCISHLIYLSLSLLVSVLIPFVVYLLFLILLFSYAFFLSLSFSVLLSFFIFTLYLSHFHTSLVPDPIPVPSCSVFFPCQHTLLASVEAVNVKCYFSINTFIGHSRIDRRCS